jgi:hypothetical protein
MLDVAVADNVVAVRRAVLASVRLGELNELSE